ncbi:sigma-70 family RNA polymerase sigma factor [Clostridium paraputrificum]|uniref:sigma-70 family RNA polymerase sigma factor n=4 Tax=Clostridium paraputrificum TaxID=29363 RepID=UPI0024802B75|nr:sigma-70 family RNA polymerase sigma factor [Clostridium paraputrificum]MDB2086777.1 sigma-70 family RNA polymerase sigma factor [Clostridium paraputrificum]
MNKEYILNIVRPFLNSEGMLGEEDFNELFSKIPKKIQYHIIDILIESKIEIDYENVRKNNLKTKVKTNSYLVDLNNITNEQLCVLYQKGNQNALEILIVKNSKLVLSRVCKYSKKYRHKLDDDDLVQYGNMGLMKAAERFDVKMENKFSTYAIWWIDQKILRSIADYGFTIRIPAHLFGQVNSFLKILYKNTDKSKKEILEILKENGIEKCKSEELFNLIKNILPITSLNIYVGEDQDSELIDFKIDEISPTVEEQVEHLFLKETIDNVLDTLSARERIIIEERFGLNDNIPKTLEEIGSEQGVTRERIRQIEAKALKRLRHRSRSKKLKGFLGD